MPIFAVMSTWGITNFENDTAAQFISDVSTNGYGLISLALDKVLDEQETPSIVECEEALIAAEIIAATAGKPSGELPDEITEWISQFLSKESSGTADVLQLTEKAADAIDFVVTHSELRELWDEHPQFNDWFETQVDLQKRLLK